MPAALMGWTGFLLWQATMRVQAEAAAALAPLGLRIPHNSVLTVLAAGPLSQVVLSARLNTDRTTMVKLIDDLEGAGLVSRERDPHDRRAHAVTLTDEGTRLLKRANARVSEADAGFFAPLSGAEHEQLRAILVRVIGAHDAERPVSQQRERRRSPDADSEADSEPGETERPRRRIR